MNPRNTWWVRGVAVVCVSILMLVLGGGTASAQGPGVVVDPESPSGKEYAIPLESARREADPRGPESSAGARAAGASTLFGVGVGVSGGRATGSSAADGRGTKRDAGSNGAAPDSGAARRATTVPKSIAVAAASPGAPAGGIGTPLVFVASGLVIVLAGVGAGLLIRRRSGG
jgi:hypothetical protein